METNKTLGTGNLNKIIQFGLVIGIFLISSTELASFQLDKALMLFLVIGLLVNYFLTGKNIPEQSFFVIMIGFGLVMLTYLINLPLSSLIVFFPIIGLTYVILIGEEEKFLDIIYWALFIHIVVGIFFVISSYVVGINSFVHPMYDKGLPFLHAAKGLTTTVQAYGTLVISWFLIYYWKKETGLLKLTDKIAYLIVILGLILTFNRNSLLIFYILLFFKHKKIFWISVIMGIGFFIYFFDFINKLIFNVSTISSRADLLEAFRIAFFEQTDWLGYLIGHGNNMVDESIAKGTYYKTGYIENGTSVLLFTYGFIGYFFYLISIAVFALMFFLKGKLFYSVMFFYIFIIAQQFTHEFYSTTIYILLSVFLLIFKQCTAIETKNNFLSPIK